MVLVADAVDGAPSGLAPWRLTPRRFLPAYICYELDEMCRYFELVFTNLGKEPISLPRLELPFAHSLLPAAASRYPPTGPPHPHVYQPDAIAPP
jgi:hypothetical protein